SKQSPFSEGFAAAPDLCGRGTQTFRRCERGQGRGLTGETGRFPREASGASVSDAVFEPLRLRQRLERALDVLPPERERCLLVRRLGRLVLAEVAELGLLLLADRLLERDRVLCHAQDLAYLVGGHLELLGDLV